ncbi:hypothetical protein [Agromyces sp. SYSU T00194]|uniref:hypothetical protein n=1 Tax=Agromyces chitinivorans TaxID=3158560 RepID=UPI00339B1140
MSERNEPFESVETEDVIYLGEPLTDDRVAEVVDRVRRIPLDHGDTLTTSG